MSPTSPPEAFRLPEVRRPRYAIARIVRLSSVAMGTGAAALIGGVLVDMAGTIALARPDVFLQLGRLEGPLFALGQVLLVGGAIARRLARRQQDRESSVSTESDDRSDARHTVD